MMKYFNLLFLSILLFTPFISYFLLEGLNLTNTATFYFRIIAIFMAIIFIIRFHMVIKIEPYLIVLLFYALYLFIWSFYNGYFTEYGIITLFHIKILQFIAVVVIINNLSFSDRFIKITYAILKVTVVIAVCFSIIQFFIPHFFIPMHEMIAFGHADSIYTARRPSIFAYEEGNAYGLTFLPIVAIIIGYSIKERKHYFLYIILSAVVIILTNGRWLYIGFLIALLTLIKDKNYNYKKVTFFLLIITVAIVLVVYLFSYNLIQLYDQRLMNEGSLTNTSRYLAWEMFQRLFPVNPVFGGGIRLTYKDLYEIKGLSYEIHVGYLSHLVSYGIIGSGLFFTGLYLIVKKFYNDARLTNYWGSFFGFIVYVWSQFTFVQFSLFYYGIIYLFIFNKYYLDKFYDNVHSSYSTNS